MKKWSLMDLMIYIWIVICLVGLVYLDFRKTMPSEKTGTEALLEDVTFWRMISIEGDNVVVSGSAPFDFYLVGKDGSLIRPDLVCYPEKREVRYVFQDKLIPAGKYKVVRTRSRIIDLVFISEKIFSIYCYLPLWVFLVYGISNIFIVGGVFLIGFAIIYKVFGEL